METPLATRSRRAEQLTHVLRRVQRTGGAVLASTIIFAGCGSNDKETTSSTARSDGDKVLVPGSRHIQEQQANTGAPTFTDTETSGKGARVEHGQKVIVDCVARGPEEIAPSAGGTWYHIISPPELAGRFVASNTFWNVEDKSIPFDQQPAVDPEVPPCPTGK